MAYVLLPADLPTNWQGGQIIAPDGANVGLPEQYGYNYLMEQVNSVQMALNEYDAGGIVASVQVSYNQL